MKVPKLMMSFILLFIFQLPGLAEAEAKPDVLNMEELTIQVMPEYSYHPKDKKKNPPLLVGYHGALKNNAEQPQKGQVVVPLPMDEKNFRIGFAGDYSRDLTEMNEIEYELDQEKGTISWETSEEIQPGEIYKFVIEYYTDSISEKDGTKELAYDFTNFTEIGLLNLIFVEPLNSESFKLEPASEQQQKNSYNMNMFLYQSQGMKAGEAKNIKLEYKRTDDRTTAEIMEDMAGDAKKAGTVKQNDEKMPLWLVITVVGSITIIAALLLIFFMKRQKTKPVQVNASSELEAKKAKLRAMLVEGSITETEYNELHKKLGGKK
ncbi:hypothetical protein QNH36_18770 [Mesobacillus sp. AQ2]|uniref:hypothetical protein n=1 Tax=Mesobacillus sp. AQ2 TaxID=3043332 RepID=UPI0024C14B20|nr:hypothetical protein [Mesobacillus sp. AQ2]WHX39698.1 hypothetical protein QNH36_18770 [Mesobacillus sp. AQ2]